MGVHGLVFELQGLKVDMFAKNRPGAAEALGCLGGEDWNQLVECLHVCLVVHLFKSCLSWLPW